MDRMRLMQDPSKGEVHLVNLDAKWADYLSTQQEVDEVMNLYGDAISRNADGTPAVANVSPDTLNRYRNP